MPYRIFFWMLENILVEYGPSRDFRIFGVLNFFVLTVHSGGSILPPLVWRDEFSEKSTFQKKKDFFCHKIGKNYWKKKNDIRFDRTRRIKDIEKKIVPPCALTAPSTSRVNYPLRNFNSRWPKTKNKKIKSLENFTEILKFWGVPRKSFWDDSNMENAQDRWKTTYFHPFFQKN